MSEDNNKKRTPLEETFDIPSLDAVQNGFGHEKPQLPADTDYDEEDEDELDFVEDRTEMSRDELLAYYNKTNKEIENLKKMEVENQQVEKYHEDVSTIHTKAMEQFEEIMGVAMAMEAAHGSKFLAGATKLLDIALNAKNSAMDRQIKMAELQLRKEKQDFEQRQGNPRDLPSGSRSPEEEPRNEEFEPVDENDADYIGAYDRNQLMSTLGNSSSDDQEKE